MFFTIEQIANSIEKLVVVHPFHGITFLVCKKACLPIGESVDFALDSETNLFLKQHHLINPDSVWFFQPFKSSDKKKKWVRYDYSAKGLQAVNTQTFLKAFIHKPKSRIWGWAPDYISLLSNKLPKNKPIPAFHLAVWLYREKKWPKNTLNLDVVKFFIKDFHITSEEKRVLFDMTPPEITHKYIFQRSKPSWYDLRPHLPPAPDAEPDQGGTLAYIETRGIGPADRLVLEPGDRLTLITGDNGLGKTFLLECAWWALSGIWADRPAFPALGKKRKRTDITFAIKGEHTHPDKKTINFDWKTLSWPQPNNRPTIPGLIVYARVDGSFAVWDPAVQMRQTSKSTRSRKSVFTSDEV